MIVNHNIPAMNANRLFQATNTRVGKSLEKLSSGFRINRAGDDAAGLTISEKMRGQVNGLNQAGRNAQDGISLIQTAEGALEETHSILQRMRTLAVQSANDTNVTADRSQIQTEIIELASEINRIASTTEFNTQNILTKEASSTQGFSALIHIGANSGQTLKVTVLNMTAKALGISANSFTNKTSGSGAFSLMTQSSSDKAISMLDDAIASVSTQRAKLGSWQNRLEHTILNLGAAEENLQSAESRIRDVDVAQESLKYAKDQVLMQSGSSMLAQSKARTQMALQLLG
jgi:flagellin